MPIFRIQEYVTNDLSSVLNLSQLSKNSIKVLHQQQVTKDIYNNAFPSAMKKMKSCNTRKETGTILDMKVKDSFLEKAVPEHLPKRWKSLSPSEIWEEIISGKWSCMRRLCGGSELSYFETHSESQCSSQYEFCLDWARLHPHPQPPTQMARFSYL